LPTEWLHAERRAEVGQADARETARLRGGEAEGAEARLGEIVD
jgi:hypothetical protein